MPSTTAVAKAEQVRLAIRVLLLLPPVGTPGNDPPVPPEATQRGLAGSLAVTQGAVSKVVSRLLAAGAISQAKGHVPGYPRRVRVYYLTRLGEDLVREFREKFGPGDPMTAAHEGGGHLLRATFMKGWKGRYGRR